MSDKWDEQVKRYLKYLGEERSERTARRYKDALDEFAAWYEGSYPDELDVALLTHEEVREWRSHLLNVRRLQASSINVRFAALKGLLRFHGRELRVSGVRQEHKAIEVLTPREIGRLRAAVEGPGELAKRNVAMMELMVRAGLRVGEVVALHREDVKLQARGGQVLIRQGKGLKERVVSLKNPEVRKALQAYLDTRQDRCDRLFVSRTGQPIVERDVHRMIVEATRRAGIEKEITPHTLRHTFAVRYMEESNGDIAGLAKVLGHENISTTTRYLHPTQEKIDQVMENL